MNASRLISSIALLAATGLAQNEGEQKTPPPKPKPVPLEAPDNAPGKQQDPKKEEEVKPLTAEDRVKQLKVSLEIAKKERSYLQEIKAKGGLGARFARMRKAAMEMQMLNPANVGPALPKKRKARLMGDAEKLSFGDKTVMAVAGVPVSEAEYNETLDYLRSFPRKDGTQDVKSDALLALIQAKAGAATFKDSASRAKQGMETVAKAIAEGQSFAEVARRYSDDKTSAERGGRLAPIKRQGGDLAFKRAAFALKVGEISKVIPSTEGYHLIRLLQKKKGETTDQDQVTVAHILKRYTDKPGAVEKLKQSIARGEIDVAFRDDDLRKFAPAQFK